MAVKEGKAIFRDHFDRWNGRGNTEFREKIQRAFATGQPVHLVLAHAENPDQIEAGVDASTVRKSYEVRDTWIGRVSRIEGEEYEIEFSRPRAHAERPHLDLDHQADVWARRQSFRLVTGRKS